MAGLTDYDCIRYDRQMRIPDWGDVGQKRIKASRVFIAGAGGLGSPVGIYLAVAGIGEIAICDADSVELSNLNRQILHHEAAVGQSKAASAKATLLALNPQVSVISHAEHLDKQSVERIVGHPDVVIDCVDNFETRYLLNTYCIRRRIPFIHGGVWGLMGQVTVLNPPATPCLRCIFPEAPHKQMVPVAGVTPGIIGCIQAMEALKYLAGVGDSLFGRLLVLDGSDMTFTSTSLKRVTSCPDCDQRA